MFLARLIGGRMQVYPLTGSFQPMAWQFVSYQKGAAAIAETELGAVVAARREMARKVMGRIYAIDGAAVLGAARHGNAR